MPAAAPRLPKIDSSTFPKFELPKEEREYLDRHQLWARQVRNIIMANPNFNQLPIESLLARILVSLAGKAAIMCQHITGDTYGTVEELLEAIGNATCGGAIQEKANNLFLNRLQHKSEDINQFCASLQMLFNRAFDEDQRSYLTFSRQFLSGLRDRDVAKAIIEREPPVAHNVEALCEAAITIEEHIPYSLE